MAYVETRNLQKYFGDVRAVDGVDLAVAEGELIVLLGPSGCGKTTLMRMIAGLEQPTAGEIYIAGERVDEDIPPRARGIAMVFQSYALYPHKTAYDNIAFPLEALRRARSFIRDAVQKAAGMFGIGHLLGQLTQMTRREPAGRHLDLTRDDRLTHSGAPGDEVRLGGQTSLYRSPAAFTATDTPLTASKIA